MFWSFFYIKQYYWHSVTFWKAGNSVAGTREKGKIEQKGLRTSVLFVVAELLVMLCYCFAVLFTCQVNPTIRSHQLFRNTWRPDSRNRIRYACPAPSIRPDPRISIVRSRSTLLTRLCGLRQFSNLTYPNIRLYRHCICYLQSTLCC